jgi:hypothetical protein
MFTKFIKIEGIGIYAAFLYNKNNGLQQPKTPSPAGEGYFLNF